MLPIYFLYLAGGSENNNMSAPSKRHMLVLNSAGFVIGFTIVFVILGAIVTSLGNSLANHRGLLEKISGLLMVVFGLNFAGILKIGFLNMEKRIDFKFSRLQFFSSIVFGMAFGFGWSPCLGAFFGSALLLAGNSRTVPEGIFLLLLYSLGLGIPFILSAVAIEKLKEAFEQIKKHSRVINIVSGILLIIAGIMVFTGSLKYIS